MKITSPWLRALLAGLAGGVAWVLGVTVFFGPAQGVLADPALQSAKMLAAFQESPAPRSVDAPWILPVALLVIGAMWGLVYRLVSASWPARWWKRGALFALVAWVMLIPWFEFYLPWNVLHEPAPLVALEMLCWAGVMFLVGMAIAGVDRVLEPRGQAGGSDGESPAQGR